ncbi:MAG TPA: hypothetical protein VEV43_02400 [Actinomycetota bacterium]|nr:hypothetical protein [Actinomycetota bacterium]
MSTTVTNQNEGAVDFRAHEGRRSSQAVGKAVFAEAAGSVDASLAASIERQKDWRKTYLSPVRKLVEAGAKSGKDALRIASEGLDAVHRNLVFAQGETETTLLDAVAGGGPETFDTGTVTGKGTRGREVVVPYRGTELRGDSLRRQLDTWVSAGVIERSCAQAVTSVVENPEWLDLSGLSFVLLGAAAEMGPLEALTKWGADVVAVDLDRPAVWDRVLGFATAGAGTLRFPEERGRAGADLLSQTPRIGAWLRSVEGPLVVGTYAYADGSTFLKLAGALDALTVSLQRGREDVSIAYLATPTDVFAVPAEVVERSRSRPASPFGRAARGLTRSKVFAANYPSTVEGEGGRKWGLADALVPQQGPNYALAKMMQRWRAITAREEGTLASANVAPATRTRSVTKNKILAAAYRGAHAFGVEVFEPETSRALMAALLVHDLRSPKAAARPETPLDHPYDLFVDGAAHGGMWTAAYAPRTVLPLAAALGAVKRKES